MSMSADLRDRLKPAAAGQVYRDEFPQGVVGNRIRLQVISDPRPVTHDGDQTLRETGVQLDCMAASRGDADDLAEAVIAAACPADLFANTAFSRSFVDRVRTYSERADTGVVTFVTSLDLRVWHQSAA
jgi:hypothetical protein